MNEKLAGMLDCLKKRSKALKKEIMAVYLACRRPELPWNIKLLGIVVIGYALSPIDLIPDFIPVLGYLDDLILIPAGLALLLKHIPAELLEECRQEAEERFSGDKPKNWTMGILIILLWIMLLTYIGFRIIGK